MANQGGTHDQHVKAGQQSHKNTDDKTRSASSRDQQPSGARDGSREKQGKAGQPGHKGH